MAMMRSVFMRYPDGKAKAVTFSYDDGVCQDKRLAELFDQYGLKATFNHNCEYMRKVNFTKEELLKLNRQLNRIRKPKDVK